MDKLRLLASMLDDFGLKYKLRPVKYKFRKELIAAIVTSYDGESGYVYDDIEVASLGDSEIRVFWYKTPVNPDYDIEKKIKTATYQLADPDSFGKLSGFLEEILKDKYVILEFEDVHNLDFEIAYEEDDLS